MSLGMVLLTLTLIAGRDGFPAMAAALRQSMLHARNEPGCIRCHVSADLASPSTFHYVEEWSTEAELRAHIRSVRFQHVIGLMEAAAMQPRFAVQLVSREYGLEYLVSARLEDGS